MKTYIITVKDMLFNKHAKVVPAHNVYHNSFTPDDVEHAFALFIKLKSDDAKDNLLSMLRFCKRDYDTDIHNDALHKNDVHAHYKKYIDVINDYINNAQLNDIKNDIDAILSQFTALQKD